MQVPNTEVQLVCACSHGMKKMNRWRNKWPTINFTKGLLDLSSPVQMYLYIFIFPFKPHIVHSDLQQRKRWWRIKTTDGRSTTGIVFSDTVTMIAVLTTFIVVNWPRIWQCYLNYKNFPISKRLGSKKNIRAIVCCQIRTSRLLRLAPLSMELVCNTKWRHLLWTVKMWSILQMHFPSTGKKKKSLYFEKKKVTEKIL